ncbi:MAG: TerB family tellurite resistance protein [Alphaproteobacteria bacterium]|nr:TerB family tellurite resistance protein [Alphaproteobacteria bacterium]
MVKQKDILNTVKNIKGEESIEDSKRFEKTPKKIQEAVNSASEAKSGIAVKACISYESMSSNVKKRTFLIRRVIKNKSEYFIDGIALDINAPRVIKVNQISCIEDLSTKTLYSDPYMYLQNVLGIEVDDAYLPEPMSDFAKAINETGSEATVLMYLVSIDNKRTAKERLAVLKYLRSRLPHLNYDDEQMNDYLISLAPDDESFSMAFHRCLKKGKLVIEPLIQAVLNVITADGVVHEKERAFLAKLIDWLKQDGYEIDVN